MKGPATMNNSFAGPGHLDLRALCWSLYRAYIGLIYGVKRLMVYGLGFGGYLILDGHGSKHQGNHHGHECSNRP